MNTNDQSTTVVQGSNTWIAVLAVICLGIVGFGVFYSTNTISNPAFLAGQYLVYALFLWAVSDGATGSGLALQHPLSSRIY